MNGPDGLSTGRHRVNGAFSVGEPVLPYGFLTKPQERSSATMAMTNVKEVFDKVPQSFNAKAAKTLDAVFQLILR